MSDFLTLADVLAMHEDLIARYGGSSAIRDPGLLNGTRLVADADTTHEFISGLYATGSFRFERLVPWLRENVGPGVNLMTTAALTP